MIVRINRTLELVFGWEGKDIWYCSLLVNCIHINELDVRLLNFSIWTSVYQVMVLLSRSVQLDLVGSIQPVRVNQPDLRVDFWVRNKGNLEVIPSSKLYPH